MSDLSPRAHEIFEEAMRIARVRLSARLGYTEREAQEAERAFLSSASVKRTRSRTPRSEGEGQADPYVPA